MSTLVISTPNLEQQDNPFSYKPIKEPTHY